MFIHLKILLFSITLLTYLQHTHSKMLYCNIFQCDSAHGSCNIFNATCLCNPLYDTYPEDGITLCNYLRKDQLTALLLELLITFGAGHYYLGKYPIAVLKTIVWLVGLSLFIALRVYNKDNTSDEDDTDDTDDNEDEDTGVENLSSNTLMISLFGCMFCGIIIVWQLIDIILFAINSYTDVNGIIMVPIEVVMRYSPLY